MSPVITRLVLGLFVLVYGPGCMPGDPGPDEASTTSAAATTNNPATLPLQATVVISRIVYRSGDAGMTWHDMSFDLPDGIQASFLAPYQEALILATDNAGLFISAENSRRWLQIGGGLPGAKINALLVAGDNILVGVYQAGIFMSKDMGQNWTSLTFDLPDLRVQSILQHRGNLLAGTDTGIFTLDRAGQRWTPLYHGVQVVSLGSLDDQIVAGTNRGTLMSDDLGASWRWVHQEGAVHYTRVVDKTIAEFCISGDLYLSTDRGATWILADYAPRFASYVYALTKIGDILVMSNNYGVHRSLDHGRHWTLIKQTDSIGFFELISTDGMLYGATRRWQERRQQKQD